MQKKHAGVVVMGVSGSGKSTIGRMLAEKIGGFFIDGDDLHSSYNIRKMADGQPLTDEDREPWLDQIGDTLFSLTVADGRPCVIAASSLKRKYRDRIRLAAPDTLFFHLTASSEVLIMRLQKRENHFMKAAMLESQISILEPLGDDEAGDTFSALDSAENLANVMVEYLQSSDRDEYL